MNAMIVVAEAVSIAAWYAVVGLDITDYDVVRSHMGAFVCTHILHLLVLTALFSAFMRRLDASTARGRSICADSCGSPSSKPSCLARRWLLACTFIEVPKCFSSDDGVVGSVPCHRSRLVFGDEAACEEAS